MTFADCIKKAGLTVEELSNAANVDYKEIKQIVDGNLDFGLIPITDGIKIAKALGTTVEDLITDINLNWRKTC